MDVPSPHLAYGCLAACVPAGARRFRIHDDGLAAALTLEGAQVVRHSGQRVDVEITAGSPLEGDADCVVVSFEVDARDQTPDGKLAGSARRLFGHALARTQTAVTRRSLRRHGYRPDFVVWWDRGHRFRPRGWPPSSGRLSSGKRLPQRAAIVAFRGRPLPSVLEATLTDVRTETGLPLRPQWAMAGTGGQLLVMTDSGVLRVALGPGLTSVRSQVAALESLWTARPPGPVRDCSPRLLARGVTGLAGWSLEQGLPGRRAARPLSSRLLKECLDFLVDLYRSGPDAGGGFRSAADQARIVARVCPPEQADQLAWLADAVDAGLATTPWGWAHGDFWPGNLLVDAGRLVGVIDWCTAGPGRPAGLDLLNLHLSLHRRRGGERWGPAVVGELLPWARAGGDDLFRAYCQKLGIELDARRLGLLVAAYWLDRISNSVEHYPNRKRRPRWFRNNVEFVLRALVEDRNGELTALR